MPRCIEQNVDWVTDLIRYMGDNNYQRVASTLEAEEEWTAHVYETGKYLLLTQVDSWMTGVNKNLPNKQKRGFPVYAGGAPQYRARCDDVAAKGYEGFELS